MATFTPDILAQGFVPDSQTEVYENDGTTNVIMTRLHFTNINATPQVVVIYLKKDGTAREWKRATLNQYDRWEIFDIGEILEVGDTIELDTTTASAVNYFINGAVQDA